MFRELEKVNASRRKWCHPASSDTKKGVILSKARHEVVDVEQQRWLPAAGACGGKIPSALGKAGEGLGGTAGLKGESLGKRIAFVGAGALGSYVGAYLAQHGEDVTMIDMWPENVEAIRTRGIELDGVTPEEKFTVTKAKAIHLTEVQSLARQKPIDIAFISVKSYDTEWATMLIKPYVAPDGYFVSLQNCFNDEKIAGIVGWGKTLGIVASVISVDMHEAARIRRTAAKGGDRHTVFRIGETHGTITKRVEELVAMFKVIDSAKGTTNLWGERWSKLTQNGMRNGVCSVTGLTSAQCDQNPAVRRFSILLGGEGVRVGQALGYQLERMHGVEPEKLAAAAMASADSMAEIEERLASKAGANPRGNMQYPSMAQDIRKGRRTEIEFMNGLIVEKGKQLGIPTPSHEKLVALVKQLERGEIKPSPSHLGG
jgi:2-dehydropantoate 2-reductase